MPTSTADTLVVFGVSGDLAKRMTFRSLYRLERRGVLACRIVGVAADDWTTETLREHMREAIAACGERLVRRDFDRLAARVCYLRGDFEDASTYTRLAAELAGSKAALFYLETPPSLFSAVVAGLAGAGLTERARVVIEKPFGHDLASARALAASLHRFLEERQIYRVDHFLGKLGLEELLYLRYANTVLEPVWNREHVSSIQVTMAERFGVDDRGRFYDAVGALRDVVVNHLLQLVAAATMEEPAAHEDIGDARYRLLRAVADADPGQAVRGQYRGYRSTPGVARGSTTETYAALQLAIDNDRWHGVPICIRTGKQLPVTQTELRLIFRESSPLTFLGRHAQPQANELVLRIDPCVGIRLMLEAHRADAQGPEPITLDMEFGGQGGEGPTAYETLFDAAMHGDRSFFVQQETVEEAWRIVQPLFDAELPALPYRRGSWGPAAAARLLPAGEHWRPLWSV